MSTPAWGITLAYWLHMLATVTWVGGLAALALLVLPSAGRVLDEPAYARLLSEIQRRLDALGWFSLAILVATGLVQMSANPNYQGFFTIGNLWAGAILVKHLVIAGMIGISAILTWGILPGLKRMVLRIERARTDPGSVDIDQLTKASRANARLIRANLILGVIVLALTAIARAA
jgi:uncharacterized membrane protein